MIIEERSFFRARDDKYYIYIYNIYIYTIYIYISEIVFFLWKHLNKIYSNL